jgi:drug/metabolite transporter (DMT)-like permease
MDLMIAPDIGVSVQRRRYAMGATLALMGALGFATSGPLSEAVLAAGLSPLQLSQVRQTVSAAILLVLVLILRPRALRLRLGQLPMVALYGITSYLLLQTFYFFAISRIPIGIALLIQFTAPGWVALWVRFVRGTRLPRMTWLGMGLTLVGLMFVGEVWHGLRLDAIGVLAALGTALCLTVFYLMAERKLGEFDPLGLVAWGSISAAVLFAIVQPVWRLPFHLLAERGGLPELRWPVWALVLVIGIMSTAFPAVWEVSAMRFIASPTASVIGTAEVVGGTVLAWVLIGQTLTVPQVIGGLVVLAGIAINQLRPLPQTQAPPRPPAVRPKVVPESTKGTL